MRVSIRGKVLLAGACMMAGLTALGQQAPLQHAKASLDVAITYNPMLANIVNNGGSFWMQGGSVQVHGQLWRGLGAAAEFTGLHTGSAGSEGVGLDLVTATFGPRYTWSPRHRRLAFFGQMMVGEAHGLNSLFPSAGGANSTANSIAYEAGGGIDVPLNRCLRLRVLDADWLRTELPNAANNAQNNLRLGAGLVFRFR